MMEKCEYLITRGISINGEVGIIRKCDEKCENVIKKRDFNRWGGFSRCGGA